MTEDARPLREIVAQAVNEQLPAIYWITPSHTDRAIAAMFNWLENVTPEMIEGAELGGARWLMGESKASGSLEAYISGALAAARAAAEKKP